MSRRINTNRMLSVVTVAIALSFPVSASAADADAMLSLARQNGCLKCHAVDRHKDGPCLLYTSDAADE